MFERNRRRHSSSSSGQLEKMSEVRLRKVGRVVDTQMRMVAKMLQREIKINKRRVNIAVGCCETRQILHLFSSEH